MKTKFSSFCFSIHICFLLYNILFKSFSFDFNTALFYEKRFVTIVVTWSYLHCKKYNSWQIQSLCQNWNFLPQNFFFIFLCLLQNIKISLKNGSPNFCWSPAKSISTTSHPRFVAAVPQNLENQLSGWSLLYETVEVL